MRNKKSTQKNGFVRIIVILLMLMLGFIFAGFNLQESFTIDAAISAVTDFWDRSIVFYEGHLQTPLQTYVLKPALKVFELINKYVIVQLVDFMQNIIDTPPVWR